MTYAQVTYTPALSSGNKADHEVMDGQLWTFKDGKLLSFVPLFSEPATLDALFGNVTSANETSVEVQVVNTVLASWGAGKFHGNSCRVFAPRLFNEDIVLNTG